MSKKKNNEGNYSVIIDIDSCAKTFRYSSTDIDLLRNVIDFIEEILHSLKLTYEIFVNWDVINYEIIEIKKHKA